MLATHRIVCTSQERWKHDDEVIRGHPDTRNLICIFVAPFRPCAFLAVGKAALIVQVRRVLDQLAVVALAALPQVEHLVGLAAPAGDDLAERIEV